LKRRPSVTDFVLTAFTDKPTVARAADFAGIDRIGVDLEYLGKAERQAGTDSLISKHSPDSLAQLASCVQRGALFARVNPLHHNTENEVERVLQHGVRVVMLPYFKQPSEVAAFIEIVAGRAIVVPLVETAESLGFVDELVRMRGVDELYFGPNDLHLSLGLKHRYEVFEVPLFLRAVEIARRSGLPFGIGGLARPNDTHLPVPPREVYRLVTTLGATRGIVGRAFFGRDYDLARLPADIALLRTSLDELRRDPAAFLRAE